MSAGLPPESEQDLLRLQMELAEAEAQAAAAKAAVARLRLQQMQHAPAAVASPPPVPTPAAIPVAVPVAVPAPVAPASMPPIPQPEAAPLAPAAPASPPEVKSPSPTQRTAPSPKAPEPAAPPAVAQPATPPPTAAPPAWPMVAAAVAPEPVRPTMPREEPRPQTVAAESPQSPAPATSPAKAQVVVKPPLKPAAPASPPPLRRDPAKPAPSKAGEKPISVETTRERGSAETALPTIKQAAPVSQLDAPAKPFPGVEAAATAQPATKPAKWATGDGTPAAAPPPNSADAAAPPRRGGWFRKQTAPGADAKNADAKNTADSEHAANAHLVTSETVRGATAFTTSLVVHLIILIVMGMYFIQQAIKPEPPELVAYTALERPEDMLNQILEENTDPATAMNMVSGGASASSLTAGAAGSVVGDAGAVESIGPPTIDHEILEAMEGPSLQVDPLSNFTARGESIASDMPEGSLGEPSAIVDSYGEAFDRITQEIIAMLAKGKVLVVWAFDQSLSMKDDQQEIRDRIETVYTELGLVDAAQGDALATGIASYGAGFIIHSEKPTSDIPLIREYIDQVPVDKTGEEMMCSAVGTSIAYFERFADAQDRKFALILVTDESGNQNDNLGTLEPAVVTAKAAQCSIYVLGREAVFGYPWCYMNWSVEDMTQNATFNFWLQVDRGPETPFVEQLQIDGFTSRWDAHPSGFGPYEQVRMARETGGIFFMLPSPEVNLVARDNRKYELELMRPYLPDLSDRMFYASERDASVLRAMMWKVITDLNPYAGPYREDVVVPVTFPIQPEAFAQLAQTGLRKAEGLVRYLHDAQLALESVAKLRDQEADFRWQANYDLMYAQTIAYQIRIYEYGAYLEAFLKQPKLIKNPLGPTMKTTHWDINTRAETLTGEQTQELRDLATRLFQKIVETHPGTPWAARAQWELARGFGVELHEAFYDPRRSLVTEIPKL